MEESSVRGINITAMGGGGFTHATYPELDDFCLEQSSRARPRLGFIGAASGDDPDRIARFHARFQGVTETHLHLPLSLDSSTLAAELNDLDMVYVGGGDTEKLLALWRRNGWDKVLTAAARSGLALVGVSAGAVCWFDSFLFHSGSGPMRPLQGLGLIEGGACPHYSTEPQRRGALHRAVAEGAMPTSLAIDDGVAVRFDASGPVTLCAAEPGAGAYVVQRTPTGSVAQTSLRR